MPKLALSKLLCISTAILLASCSMPNTKKADAREWIEVTCNGFSDWTKCNDKAAKLCPDGYEVGSREESLIAQHRGMTIACKK